MTRHTFESLQTICILTLCANNFGASSHLVSLLHMGLHIAQARGLHVLGAEEEGKVPPPGLRKRELGRTVWGALELGIAYVQLPLASRPLLFFLSHVPELNLYRCTQTLAGAATALLAHPAAGLLGAASQSRRAGPGRGSAFSAPTARMHDLAVCVRPRLAFARLVDRADAPPCSARSHILVNYLGRLVRQFNREFWAAPSLEAQWKLVQATDTDFVRLIDSFPQFKPTPEPYPQYIDLDDKLPYLEWARHHMAVGVPRIRMTLHRCFLRKSYSDPTYLKSRQVRRLVLAALSSPRRGTALTKSSSSCRSASRALEQFSPSVNARSPRFLIGLGASLSRALSPSNLLSSPRD